MLNSILTIGRNCWDISDAKETGLLIDGRDYYLAFYRTASKAERYILICGSAVTLRWMEIRKTIRS